MPKFRLEATATWSRSCRSRRGYNAQADCEGIANNERARVLSHAFLWLSLDEVKALAAANTR